jgi:hypothetical protein
MSAVKFYVSNVIAWLKYLSASLCPTERSLHTTSNECNWKVVIDICILQVTPSPSTALIGTPSPGTLLNVGSPGNPQLHVPSPGSSAFVPAPSPQSLGIHMQSPASGFMGPQGTDSLYLIIRWWWIVLNLESSTCCEISYFRCKCDVNIFSDVCVCCIPL